MRKAAFPKGEISPFIACYSLPDLPFSHLGIMVSHRENDIFFCSGCIFDLNHLVINVGATTPATLRGFSDAILQNMVARSVRNRAMQHCNAL